VKDDESKDAELVAATARGDDRAFAVLVRRYIRTATLLGAQLLGDRDDAEDVVQEAFTVVHRNASAFDTGRPFGPWFFAIVRRLAANRRSGEMRRARLLRMFGSKTITESPAQGGAEVVARLDAVAVAQAVEGLSAMQRACFELVAVRGLSTADVAAMHGITESTVRQHVFRARAAIRAAVGEEQPMEEKS
jgi:RNA polymerase sigma-70 factor (ECF subfamily)